MVDGTVITEALYAPLIALILLLGYRLLDGGGGLWLAAGLGAAIGLATLTRTEAIGLVVLLAVPLCVAAARRRSDPPARIRDALRPALPLAAVAVAATVLVLVPWVVRNAITLDRAVVFTTNSGHTAAATVCDDTFRGGSPYLGFVRHQCALTGPCAAIADELDQAACQRDAAWRYMRDHAGRVPVVPRSGSCASGSSTATRTISATASCGAARSRWPRRDSSCTR